jgi:hypothetical protein
MTDTTIVPGDKSLGAAHIAAHPEDFGFSWDAGAIGVGTGENYRELRADCPHINVEAHQLPLFAATFPAVLVDSVNGTSVKVKCDRVNRTRIQKDRKITTAALREQIVSSVLLSVITRSAGVPRTVYIVNGVEYVNETEAKAASQGDDKARQTSAAQAFLAMCADSGVDSAVARHLAEQQYPLAFVDSDADADDEQ